MLLLLRVSRGWLPLVPGRLHHHGVQPLHVVSVVVRVGEQGLEVDLQVHEVGVYSDQALEGCQDLVAVGFQWNLGLK